jgi:hypothetical protein
VFIYHSQGNESIMSPDEEQIPASAEKEALRIWTSQRHVHTSVINPLGTL